MTDGAQWNGRPQPPIDAAFVAGASIWLRDSEDVLLQRVWEGFDELARERPAFDGRDLERNITERLESCIQDGMSGYEPFTVQHGPHERETMQPPPAQPPQYDIAFVFRADSRIMWPLEAKVLETPRTLAAYVNDVNEQFLTCRYAPFSPSGAMLGYLLSGDAEDAFNGLSTRLGCELEIPVRYAERPGRASMHVRSVPTGKPYPKDFRCHHLIMVFAGVVRTTRIGAPHIASEIPASES
ncbi:MULTISPECIES: hypothetical protein [unclassified Devosia]|uniref:hypothetical protein n=1 Tax=unclassified Devosia TaxID=196773 RepID=UPI000AE30488|nr:MULTISPECIES: hypothetical protein [unclassified Devosia]MBN9307211.1 hypothetical protein [Devosia sp.]